MWQEHTRGSYDSQSPKSRPRNLMSRRSDLLRLGYATPQVNQAQEHHSTSIFPSSPFLSLTYATNSSSTPGHAPSSLHQLIVSSFRLFWENTRVCSHISLLTVFFHLLSRYSIHQSSHGVLAVFQLTEGGLNSNRQNSIAASRATAFWPGVRAMRNVCL